MNTIPWYQSAILRQQIVQLLTAALLLFGVSSDAIDVDQTTGLIFGGVAGLTAVWTFLTRLYKPTPPITAEAQLKTEALVKRQGGYTRVLVLAVLLGICAPILVIAPGCVGTRSAYAEAHSLDQYAFVLTEHYAALLKQAADLRGKPSTPANAIAALQKADSFAAPAVKKLRGLADAYLTTKSAQSESELQAAVNAAVLTLADFVRTIRAAAGSPQGAVVPNALQSAPCPDDVVTCALQGVRS